MIIPETQINPETQLQRTSDIQFMSPFIVTHRYNILQSTPDATNTSTPNPESRNKKLLHYHKTNNNIKQKHLLEDSITPVSLTQDV